MSYESLGDFVLRRKKLYLLTLTVIFGLEMVLKGATQGFNISPLFWMEILLIFLISCCVATVPYFFRATLKGKTGKIIYAILMVGLAGCYCAQIVYNSIFGTYFTLYSVLHGTGQVFEFYQVALNYIWKEKVYIISIVIVVILTIIVVCKTKTKSERYPQKHDKILITFFCSLLMISSILTTYLLLSVENDNPKSPYQKIFVIGEMKSSVESLGFIGGAAIDGWRIVFGFNPKLSEEENFVVVEKGDNIIESLDFEAMAGSESNETLKNMHIYFGANEPTKKNDKTGIFEGKNLVFITAEGFSDFAIDPVYTPTLYKLYNEGFKFENFYNPVWGVSTLDGEYVNLQGLIPKPGVWSMLESSSNDLPFTLGNQFMKLGYNTKAFHNHSIYYYDRNVSHPNLGYEFKGQGREYSFEETWPESDVEMIDETTWEFLTPDENGEIKPFQTYYLTVSGHLSYSFSGNQMAAKNKEMVQDMNMSDSCKAYMATQIELDRAVELLIEKLDEAGVLEDTVIAIAGDHYPYGLTNEEISEFKGREIDEEYELYESAFILWTPNMESETVYKVCSNLDILPTLSNLFGLEYDSRLLMGSDIFSEKEGLVVFKDKNWLTDSGTRSYLESTFPEYVRQIDKKVSNMFNYSSLILDKDYYSLIFKNN